MITRNEIKEAIEGKLNSATWSKLKSSFIGRELIEYATTVIYQNNLYKKLLQYQQYPDTADADGLLMQAYNLGIPVDTTRPSYIKLNVNTKDIIKPYTARFSVGASLFTNFLFTSPGEQLLLYQGSVVSTYNEIVDDLPFDKEKKFTVYYDEYEESYYIKLGKDALFETVRVTSSEDGLFCFYSLYDSLRAGAESRIYKLVRNYDGSLNVYFGNGVWGKKYNPEYKYQITWIDSTVNDFEVSRGSLSVAGSPAEFTIESYDSGERDDLQYLRSSVKSEIAKNAVIGTEYQILAAVRQYPTVLDCVVIADIGNSNKVLIYVKPVTSGDIYFDDVQDMLTLKGEIVTQFVVLPGTPLEFFVELESISSISSQLKQDVEHLLSTDLSYKSLPYITDISSVRLSEKINEIASGSVVATVKLRQYFDIVSSFITLPIRPYKGTIQLYRDNQLVGWDSEGILYGMFENSTLTLFKNTKPGYVLKFGDFYIVSLDDEVNVYNSNFTQKTVNTETFKFANIQSSVRDGNRCIGYDGEELKIVDIDQTFDEGPNSIMRNPMSFVNVTEIKKNLPLDNCVYVQNNGIYKMVYQDEFWVIKKYSENSGFSEFSGYDRSVSGAPGWDFVGMVILGGDLVFFFKQGVRVLKNFTLPTEDPMTVEIQGFTLLQENINNLSYVYGGDVLYLGFTEKQTSGDEVATFYRISNWSIKSNSSTNSISVSDPVEYASIQDPNKKPVSIQVIDIDMSYLQVFDKSAGAIEKIAYGGIQDITLDGKPVSEFVKMGTVSYNQKMISLNGRTEEDITVEYASTDPLSQLSKSYYPVLSEITWKQ